MLPAMVIAQSVRPAASSYAVVRSAMPSAATGSPAFMDPTSVPGGNPVTAVPGLTPRSPVTEVGPVLVTVEPPSTTNLSAAPSATGPCPQADVVKLQTYLAAIGVPATSLAPVPIVTEKTSLNPRSLEGMNVPIVPA